MADEVDRRTVNGCRKRVERLLSKERPEGLLLKQFFKQVQTALQLTPTQIPTLSEAELTGCIATMVSAGITFPYATRLGLLERRRSRLMAQMKYEELVPVLSPFVVSEFDPMQPTLGSLDDDGKKKTSLFQQMMFKDVFVPMIANAQDVHSKIFNLSEHCLHLFGHLDLVDCDNATASMLDESTSVWRALSALLSCSLSAEPLVAYQRRTLENHVSWSLLGPV